MRFVCAFLLLLVSAEAQTTNSWISMGAGNWQSAGNWSLARIPTNTDSVFFTNAINKAIFINSATTGTTSMVVSNLTVSAPVGSTNELMLNSAGTNVPLRILNTATISARGRLLVSNSAVHVSTAIATGSLIVDGGGFVSLLGGGILIATNQEADIGLAGTGELSVTNATLRVNSLIVAAGVGSKGTFTLDGLAEMKSNWGVGVGDKATGTVWMTGGQLIATNSTTIVSENGVGQMIVSNGIVLTGWSFVGNKGVGTLTLAGGTVVSDFDTNAVFGSIVVGHTSTSTGTIWITSGQLIATNTIANGKPSLILGNSSVGRMALSNGTVNVGTITIARSPGSAGTLTVAGGTFTAKMLEATNASSQVRFTGGTITLSGAEISSSVPVGADGRTAVLNLTGGTHHIEGLAIGYLANATGTVWKTDGVLISSNSLVSIGYASVGRMTVSNATWRAYSVEVGTFGGGQGTLTIAGSTNSLLVLEMGGENLYATGQVWMTSGMLTLSNGNTLVGIEGVGRMAVSNGVFRTRGMIVGLLAKSQGTLTIAGGISSVYSNLTLGETPCTSAGIVDVVAGALRVTNNTATAVLEVRSGTLTHSGGTLDIDRLIITNTCGRFVHTGGTLITGLVTLTPGSDADGDGLPNNYEQSYGFDPLDPRDAALDSDGDGRSNLEEYNTNTDPTDANSYLHFSSIVLIGPDVLLTWQMAEFTAYHVLGGTNVAGGITNYLSTKIYTPFGGGGSFTNYPDIGGATNRPGRFYRLVGYLDTP